MFYIKVLWKKHLYLPTLIELLKKIFLNIFVKQFV